MKAWHCCCVRPRKIFNTSGSERMCIFVRLDLISGLDRLKERQCNVVLLLQASHGKFGGVEENMGQARYLSDRPSAISTEGQVNPVGAAFYTIQPHADLALKLVVCYLLILIMYEKSYL
jgi:hypothetical protein